MSNYEKNTVKRLQKRRTFSDTLNSQEMLRSLLKKKIENPVLSKSEAGILPRLVAESLLSAGGHATFEYHWKSEDGKDSCVLTWGNSLHSTLLKMETIAIAPWVRQIFHGRWVVINISDLWSALLDRCLDIFPTALGESHQRSKESEIKEPITSYRFSVDDESILEDKS